MLSTDLCLCTSEWRLQFVTIKKKDVTEAIKNLFSDAPLITEMVVVVAKGGWGWGYVTRGKKETLLDVIVN